MFGGYAGKILNVNLTTREITEEALDEESAFAFLGGYGLGAKYLFKRMKANADPLGPDNVLGFVTGPLTGTPALFGGRYMAVCKSPVSQTWNDANCGGYFGPELKKAGFDGVFINGISENPVYLWISGGRAELRDAKKYWGMDTQAAFDAFKEDLGDGKIQAALIGPGGENVSLLACVIDDYHRALGRGGVGAVMGSKKLKAIVARGTDKITVTNLEALRELNKKIAEGLKTSGGAAAYRERGTGGYTDNAVFGGDCPVFNWGDGVSKFGDISELGTVKMDKYKTGKYHCAGCPLGCGAHYDVKDGRWPIGKTQRPEYETIGMFGPMCGHADVDAIIKCNDLCNRAGIDTISTGATVAWAMECYSNNLITKEQTGGIDLQWGNSQGMVEAVEAIVNNTPFGKILGQGSAAAAKLLKTGEQYVMAVRGIELPAHDARLCPGYARTYQYDPTPARHVKGGLGLSQGSKPPEEKYNTKDNGMADYVTTSLYDLFNIAGLCYFVILCGLPWGEFIPELIEAVTGIPKADCLKAGYRALTARHLFNVREGLRRKDFFFPGRLAGRPPLTEGINKGITLDNERLADDFFRAAGWDEQTGVPKRETVEQLGYMTEMLDFCVSGN
ncbi:MAG: aldehyde ferredoxin oxidoreductase family protein [Spirochaetales bacterium]|nr:aldehyde ferredoxin oxidoreductase family protein [Spirochaetales bacterium]